MPVDYDVIANAIVEAETDTAVKAVEEDLVILKQEGLNDLEAAKAILNDIQRHDDIIIISLFIFL